MSKDKEPKSTQKPSVAAREAVAGVSSSECHKAADIEVTEVHVTSQTYVAFDFYSCEECIKRLNDYLDHELSAQEREDVVKHLNLCKPCLERFHFEENLIVSLRKKATDICASANLRAKLSQIIKKTNLFLLFY